MSKHECWVCRDDCDCICGDDDCSGCAFCTGQLDELDEVMPDDAEDCANPFEEPA